MTTGRDLKGHEPRAVQKALLLLESVAEIGSGATAKQIALRAGIPPATAYRLLNLLVADGYLVRIADLSGFALGMRTRQLAGAAVQPATDRDLVLADLRGSVRHGIYLACFDGDRLRLADRDPDHELAGERLIAEHLQASAMGKMLLASRGGPVPDELRRITPRTVVDPAALAAELAQVRAEGIAIEVDEMRLGRSAVAVAVVDDGGRVVGSLAAIGRTGRLPVRDPELTELLRSCALRIGSTSEDPSLPTPSPKVYHR